MKKQPDNLPGAELRYQAETKLIERKRREAVFPVTESDTRRLVHELEVHQIELELQNEELGQSRSQVETVLRQYTDLYDFAPIGYFTLAHDGTIHQVNLAGANLLGVERGALIGRRFGAFVSVESRSVFNAFIGNVFGSQQKAACEVQLLKDGSAPLWLQIEAIRDDGQREGCRAVTSDITERKRAEEDLRQATREREKLIQELQYALDNIKTLQGLIPICANCKKIRDDQGFWNQVEKYIMAYSTATFTHGICPDCAKIFSGDHHAEQLKS